MDALERAGIPMKTADRHALGRRFAGQFVDAFAQLLKATGSRKSGQSTARSIPFVHPAGKARCRSRRCAHGWQKMTKCAACGEGMPRSGREPMKITGSAGWESPDDQISHIEHLTSLAAEVKQAGFKHALLSGWEGRAFAQKSCGSRLED